MAEKNQTAAVLPNLYAIVAVCDDWGSAARVTCWCATARTCALLWPTPKATRCLWEERPSSFPDAKPLVDRRNIVVSRQEGFAPEGVEVAATLEDALALAAGDKEVWVIGGGQVYQALLPRCAKAVVTKNHCVREADTFFPNLDTDPTWKVAETTFGGTTKSGIDFDFVTYIRA